AEDEEDELHRRLEAILGHYGATFNDIVGGLHLLSVRGPRTQVWPTPREYSLPKRAELASNASSRRWGAWRGSSVSLCPQKKRERKHLVWPRVSATLRHLSSREQLTKAAIQI